MSVLIEMRTDILPWINDPTYKPMVGPAAGGAGFWKTSIGLITGGTGATGPGMGVATGAKILW